MKSSQKDISALLSSGPVQRLLADLENSDVHKLLMKHREMLGIPVKDLAEQLQSRKKAKYKLPLYYNTGGVVFPPPSNLEQCSSEATARFKAELIRQRLTTPSIIAADLTGGFGVDTYFLSRVAAKTHYVEPEQNLLTLARYNHELLGAENIAYHQTTAEEYLNSTDASFDIVYLDPSRRTNDKRRIRDLADAYPNVLEIQDEVIRRSKVMLVKASPLLDIHAAIHQLKSVNRVIVVSVLNECKELLFWCSPEKKEEPVIEAFDLDSTGAVISRLAFTASDEKAIQPESAEPGRYLYEPNAAIMKAGAFKSVGRHFGVAKIHPNTHLYTSAELIPEFPGRTFEIEGFVKRNDVRRYLPEGQANVLTRNYPMTPDALKQKLKLRDGGEKFIIGFSGSNTKYLAVGRRL